MCTVVEAVYALSNLIIIAIVPNLQLRIPGIQEARWFSCSHTANEQQTGIFTFVLPNSEVHAVSTHQVFDILGV